LTNVIGRYDIRDGYRETFVSNDESVITDRDKPLAANSVIQAKISTGR